jgi:hypothetical protein
MTNGHRLGLWITAIGLGLTLVGAPALAAPPATPSSLRAAATQGGAPAPTRSLAAPARERGYAQREAATPRNADFKGNGVGIYIGGSTLAVVLVVVLIVVLL